MRNLSLALAIAIFGACIPCARGDVRRLLVGSLIKPWVITLQFEDQTSEVYAGWNNTAAAPHEWITLNHDRTHLYGASLQSPFISSYTVVNGSSLRLDRTVPLSGACLGKHTAFVAASKQAPYRVYTGSFPGPNACGAALDADSTGALASVSQTWSYAPRSGIRGVTLGRSANRCDNGSAELVYAADFSSDAIWTHAIGGAGSVTERGRLATATGAHPRHLVLHTTGKRLYVLLEATSSVVSYLVDAVTGLPSSQEGSFPLLPTGIPNPGHFYSTDVALNHNGSYLWATTRPQDDTLDYGYLSGLQLDSTDGRIIKRMFVERTPSSEFTGGVPNAVAPTAFVTQYTGELAAVTTTRAGLGGYVQFWRMTGGIPSPYGTEYTGARWYQSAAVKLMDGGCCSNIAWIS